MNKKSWIIFAVIVVAVFGLLIYRAQDDKNSISDVDVFTIQKPSPENGEIGDHVLNPSNNAAILIEYGDFQCPGCQSAHIVVKEMMEEYAGKVQYVFRNYPMSYHVNAKAASAAAESAGLQDRYWDMFNIIYEQSDEWENSSASDRTDVFLRYAKEIGLDLDKFKKDLDSDRIKKKINYDVALGRKTGITGTPSFYINGEVLKNESIHDKDAFRKALNEAIK